MYGVLLLLIACAIAPAHAQQVRLTAQASDETVSLSMQRVPHDLTRAPRVPERLLQWHNAQPGLSWTELSLSAGTMHHALRAVIVRIDPRLFDMQLALVTKPNGMTGAWNVDSAADDVVLAFNAGQFKETGPWGWLVMESYERRNPGYGPISAGVAIDSAGALRWLTARQLAQARSDRSIRYAFQSYPLLMFDRKVPALLLSSHDVDREHRDTRLVLAERDDSTLLVVLTRFQGFGALGQRVPIGLTVPESVVLMAALGARHALMLDGGISAQLLVRSESETYEWPGWRDVPLALLARRKAR